MTYVIGEIGINHNGDVSICQRLIAAAAVAGFDAVKFQTRTIESVYTPEELAKPRETPYGSTNGDLKRQLELADYQYDAIDRICHEFDVAWFSSCWDHASVDRIARFRPPYFKIASACLTDDHLVSYTCQQGTPIILSTGMSTLPEIDHAVDLIQGFGNSLSLLHCTSTYPSRDEEINLRCIRTLRERYGLPVGYSGHEAGLTTTFAAVALGAEIIERHITLDRTMFGSDQAASIEPQGMLKLVRGIRSIEAAMGDGRKRVYDSELPIRDKLRRCQHV